MGGTYYLLDAFVCEKDDDERDAWREADLLAGQRGAARAKVFGLRAQLEKARQALRRRKRLHADGGLPDW